MISNPKDLKKFSKDFDYTHYLNYDSVPKMIRIEEGAAKVLGAGALGAGAGAGLGWYLGDHDLIPKDLGEFLGNHDSKMLVDKDQAIVNEELKKQLLNDALKRNQNVLNTYSELNKFANPFNGNHTNEPEYFRNHIYDKTNHTWGEAGTEVVRKKLMHNIQNELSAIRLEKMDLIKKYTEQVKHLLALKNQLTPTDQQLVLKLKNELMQAQNDPSNNSLDLVNNTYQNLIKQFTIDNASASGKNAEIQNVIDTFKQDIDATTAKLNQVMDAEKHYETANKYINQGQIDKAMKEITNPDKPIIDPKKGYEGQYDNPYLKTAYEDMTKDRQMQAYVNAWNHEHPDEKIEYDSIANRFKGGFFKDHPELQDRENLLKYFNDPKHKELFANKDHLKDYTEKNLDASKFTEHKTIKTAVDKQPLLTKEQAIGAGAALGGLTLGAMAVDDKKEKSEDFNGFGAPQYPNPAFQPVHQPLQQPAQLQFNSPAYGQPPVFNTTPAGALPAPQQTPTPTAQSILNQKQPNS